MKNSTTNSQILLAQQSSHSLLVFSNAKEGQEQAYLDWFTSAGLSTALENKKVLSLQHYQQHSLDLIGGAKPIGFDYLAVYQLCLDGAEDSDHLIKEIHSAYQIQSSVSEIAIWLYYPISEKVGCQNTEDSAFISIAFANAKEGCVAELREWYSTEHIRHALIIPAFTSGQCFALTGYQQSGVKASDYQIIAVYEQNDTPENLVASLSGIDVSKLIFSSALDTERFTEWSYRAITKRVYGEHNE